MSEQNHDNPPLDGGPPSPAPGTENPPMDISSAGNRSAQGWSSEEPSSGQGGSAGADHNPPMDDSPASAGDSNDNPPMEDSGPDGEADVGSSENPPMP
ncbi:MAG: hypothetical protein ACR2QK_18700 [Acidimicrobiales bacterium]